MADFSRPGRFNALPAGAAVGPHYRWQVVPIVASIANTDTAEIELEGIPVVDEAYSGHPVVVGLPAGLSVTVSGNKLELTADDNVGTFEGTLLILLKK